MPTPPRRWSPRLEGLRAGADVAAQHAAYHLNLSTKLVEEAIGLLRRDPDLAKQLLMQALGEISRAETEQERIQRLMLEARLGRD